MQEVKAIAERGSGLASFNLYREKTLPLVLKLRESLIELSDFNYNNGLESTKQGVV